LFNAIVGGSQDGYWVDQDLNLITNILLDFLGQDTGFYNFNYIIENPPPCENSIYEFSVIAEGCEILIEDDIDITVPTIFSPNGDGSNDWFYPFSTIDLEVQSFNIFDRWGNQVFSNKNIFTNSPQDGWDGNFNGENTASGVYVYIINLRDNIGNSIIVSGDVTVIR
jgi:gliding motility-associated-like protein